MHEYRESDKAHCEQAAPCQSFGAVARSERGPHIAHAFDAPLDPQGKPVIAPFSSVEDLHSQIELYSIVNAACLLNNSSGYVQGIKKRRDSQHVKVQRYNFSGVASGASDGPESSLIRYTLWRPSLLIVVSRTWRTEVTLETHAKVLQASMSCDPPGTRLPPSRLRCAAH